MLRAPAKMHFRPLLTGVGAVLSAAAQNLAMLTLGKLIYGLGIAFALHAAPAYLAEMGHPRIRGLLIGCAISCMCSFGQTARRLVLGLCQPALQTQM